MCAFSLKDVTMPGLVPLLAVHVHVFCLVWVITLLQGVLFAFTLSVAADLQSSFGLLKGCFPFAMCYWKEVLLT